MVHTLPSSNAPASAPLVSVFNGRECRGHVLARGPSGFEAFTTDDRSIGVFKTQADAANALVEKGAS
jgi:hypothetical protein